MFHQSGLDFTRAESGDERNADSFIDSEREQGYTDAVGRGEANTRTHTQGIRPHVDYSMILGLLATLSFNPSFFFFFNPKKHHTIQVCVAQGITVT